ncbi:hypothetical protein ACFPOE_11280 [Caenimonas terrae]|uniref:Uncharacterized protein n=1 Tax=Caenimonas terrae TaxID=696074 RepID=A0ABW0NEX7_9BURK
MAMTLANAHLTELAAILRAVEYRLVTSDGQMLAEAAPGEVLSDANAVTLDLGPELALLARAREILKPEDDAAKEKAAVHRGIAKG